MEFFRGMSVGEERKESALDQSEIRDDLVGLIREGLLTNGRHAQIDLVANSTNQFIVLEEDGSSAIVTVRGPRTDAMMESGARSFASASRDGTWADPDISDDGMISDTMEDERVKAAEEWAASQDGDDGE